jgi:hypothetical protein
VAAALRWALVACLNLFAVAAPPARRHGGRRRSAAKKHEVGTIEHFA